MATLDQFLVDHAIAGDAVWRLKVALDEVLSNVVKHSYGEAAGVIEVRFVLNAQELEITIIDDGQECDPLAGAPPDTTSPLESREPGGLGVYLVKQLSDRVAYTRRDGRNYLVFAKRVD